MPHDVMPIRLRPGVEPLSRAERERKSRLEVIVEEGISGTAAMALALESLGREKLWREDYESAEDYIERRFGISKAHYYRLIQAGVISEAIGVKLTEYQARALAGHVPETQQAAVAAAQEQTGEPSPSASALRQALKDLGAERQQGRGGRPCLTREEKAERLRDQFGRLCEGLEARQAPQLALVLVPLLDVIVQRLESAVIAERARHVLGDLRSVFSEAASHCA